MVCTPVSIGGFRGVVCGPRARRRRCKVCCSAWATRLCDGFEYTSDGMNSEECSVPLCEQCTRVVLGHGRPGEAREQADLCPACAGNWLERVAIMTVEGVELREALRAASEYALLGPGPRT